LEPIRLKLCFSFCPRDDTAAEQGKKENSSNFAAKGVRVFPGRLIFWYNSAFGS
jgi:hypothetical protein